MWRIRIRRWGARIFVWITLAASVGIVAAMVAIAFATPSATPIRPVANPGIDIPLRDRSAATQSFVTQPHASVAGSLSNVPASDPSIDVIVADPPYLDPILTERMGELVTCGAGARVLDAGLTQLAHAIALRGAAQPPPETTTEVVVIASLALPPAYVSPTMVAPVDPDGCTTGDLSWESTLAPLIAHAPRPLTRLGVVVYRYSPYYPPELLLLGQ